MKLDATTIVVLVMTLTAVMFLVLFEIRSRRNSRLQQAEAPPEVGKAAEAAEPVVPAEAAVRKKRRRR